MNTVKQVSTFMENKPGELSSILKILSDANIDIRALNVAEVSDYGVLRFMADDSEKAIKTLKENGLIASYTDVAVIEVPDEPGGLYGLLEKFAKDGVDIEYMYSVVGFEKGKSNMVICVKNFDTLSKSIEDRKIVTADKKTLGIN